MGNDALVDNSRQALSNISISSHGSNWLYAVFAVMAVSAIVFTVWAQTRHPGTRIFHFIAAVICTTTAISYYSMASNLGSTPIPVEFIRGGTLGRAWVNLGVDSPTRAIWFARYIQWTITTPLILLAFLLVSGLPLADIFTTLFFSIVWVETGLMGALTISSYKWGFYAFRWAAYIYIAYVLLGPARISARAVGVRYSEVYTSSAMALGLLLLVYPIIWGLSEGGNVIRPTSEMIAYGVLDIFTFSFLMFYFCSAVDKTDFTRLNFNRGLPGINGDTIGHTEISHAGNANHHLVGGNVNSVNNTHSGTATGLPLTNTGVPTGNHVTHPVAGAVH